MTLLHDIGDVVVAHAMHIGEARMQAIAEEV